MGYLRRPRTPRGEQARRCRYRYILGSPESTRSQCSEPCLVARSPSSVLGTHSKLLFRTPAAPVSCAGTGAVETARATAVGEEADATAVVVAVGVRGMPAGEEAGATKVEGVGVRTRGPLRYRRRRHRPRRPLARPPPKLEPEPGLGPKLSPELELIPPEPETIQTAGVWSHRRNQSSGRVLSGPRRGRGYLRKKGERALWLVAWLAGVRFLARRIPQGGSCLSTTACGTVRCAIRSTNRVVYTYIHIYTYIYI